MLKARRKIKDSPSKEPPPPDLAAGAVAFSITLADACTDWPLAADMQVSIKLKVSGVADAEDSVTAALPLVGFVPGQASPAPPPLAEQLLALAELHVSVVA